MLAEDPLRRYWIGEGAYFLVPPVSGTGITSILVTRDLGVHSYYVSQFVRSPTYFLFIVDL